VRLQRRALQQGFYRRAAQQELERPGVTFTGAPHMIYKHPDGLEEWLTFFHDPGGGILSLISRVKS
jgi:hypothetical protein